MVQGNPSPEPVDPLIESGDNSHQKHKKSSKSLDGSSHHSKKSKSKKHHHRQHHHHVDHKSSAPVTLIEVMQMESATRKICRSGKSCVNHNKKKKKKKSDKKTVRFATNGKNDKVWCLVKEFDKIDSELSKTLFWDSDELYETYSDDKGVLDVVEPAYFQALRSAYKSSLSKDCNEKTVEMDDDAMAMCSNARGMEIDVFPYLRDFAKRHREEVMGVWEEISKDGRIPDDLDLEEMRATSIRYSKGNRLVAARMAQFDNKDSHYSFKSG